MTFGSFSEKKSTNSLGNVCPCLTTFEDVAMTFSHDNVVTYPALTSFVPQAMSSVARKDKPEMASLYTSIGGRSEDPCSDAQESKASMSDPTSDDILLEDRKGCVTLIGAFASYS